MNCPFNYEDDKCILRCMVGLYACVLKNQLGWLTGKDLIQFTKFNPSLYQQIEKQFIEKGYVFDTKLDKWILQNGPPNKNII